jgi:lipoprotein-anchoring transpeptidase ErfK/SrfK
MNRGLQISLVVLAGIFGLAAILLMLDNAAYAALRDRVPPKTIVAGVAVGGLSVKEANNRINARTAELLQTPLTITADEKTATTSAADLGITAQATSLQVASDQWAWLHLPYWAGFFSKKTSSAAYAIDEQKFATAIETTLGAGIQPEDAKIEISGNEIKVVAEKAGKTVDVQPLKTALAALFTTGTSPSTVTLQATEKPAQITAERATVVKNEIEQAATTSNFKDEDRSFTFDKSALLQAIDITSENGTLVWRINSDKLKTQLKNTVVRKATIKMSPKTIQAVDGAITSEGQDGREVQIDELTRLVETAITQKTDTAKEPITIPMKVVAHTEKTIYPSFVAGLFPGKYITVNLGEQKMYLLEGQNKIGEYTVSTGKWSTPTPKGTFYIMNKISLAYSRPFRLWMPMWNGLAANPDGSGYKGYGIHGLPCWNRACTSREGESHIGTPVSHGCIRLNDDAVAFVYNWADVGTPVDIH